MSRISGFPEPMFQPRVIQSIPAPAVANSVALVPQAAVRFGAAQTQEPRRNFFSRIFHGMVKTFRYLMTSIGNLFMRLAGRKTADQMEAELSVEQRRNKEMDLWRSILSSVPPDELARWDRQRAKRVKAVVQQANQPLTYNHLPASTYTTPDSYARFKTVNDMPLSPVKTNLRNSIPLLSVPDFNLIQRQPLDVTLPVYSPVKPVIKPNANIDMTDDDVTKFVAERERSTNFLRSYGEGSINWTPEKVARDMMQNFYDGHNHTLEGVRLTVAYDPGKRSYKVKVYGQAQYNHREIEDMGAGDKSDNEKNAGGFGEGSKVFTIRLLAKHNVEKVTYSSADWKIDFKLGNSKRNDMTRVYKTLEKVPHQKGNTLEFDTTDTALVKAVLESTQYFYHPGNPDYKAPSFENDTWGYRVNGLGKPGNLTVVQRFEAPTEGKWTNGLDGVTIYGFKKPPVTVFNAGRDRQNIDENELSAILKKSYVKSMNDADLIQGVKNLEAVWNWTGMNRQLGGSDQVEKHPMVIMLSAFCDELSHRRIGVRLPAKKLWVAPTSNYTPPDILNYLENKGYFICHPSMRRIGVPTIDDVMEGLRQHTPLVPTTKEKQKIQLLKMAASVLVDDLYLSKDKSQPLLRQKDVERPLYLFNRQAVVDQNTTLAQAIIDNDRDADDSQWHAPSIFKGSWFDRNYLNTAPFEELVSTYLHEMTHQYGGDGSHEFGYKLTDWIAESLASSIRNPATRHRLSDIRTAWEELDGRKLAAVA